MEKTVYLSGTLVPKSEALVSVTDYGFTYGASVYEVVLVYGGKPYRLGDHLERYVKNASFLGIRLDSKELAKASLELIERNLEGHAILYLQTSLGNYAFRSPVIPSPLCPTTVIFTQEQKPHPPEYYTKGIHLLSNVDPRGEYCHIKSTSLLPNLITYNEAHAKGAQEVVFIDKANRQITECATSNIFCVYGKTLYTPQESPKILPGITKTRIISLAREKGVVITEQAFSLDFLLGADEVFISSTTKEVVPVYKVDSTDISLCPGPVTQELAWLMIRDIERETSAKHWKRDFLGNEE